MERVDGDVRVDFLFESRSDLVQFIRGRWWKSNPLFPFDGEVDIDEVVGPGQETDQPGYEENETLRKTEM